MNSILYDLPPILTPPLALTQSRPDQATVEAGFAPCRDRPGERRQKADLDGIAGSEGDARQAGADRRQRRPRCRRGAEKFPPADFVVERLAQHICLPDLIRRGLVARRRSQRAEWQPSSTLNGLRVRNRRSIRQRYDQFQPIYPTDRLNLHDCDQSRIEWQIAGWLQAKYAVLGYSGRLPTARPEPDGR